MKFGQTVYLLEPNVKKSKGGLRDFHLLRWAGMARFQPVPTRAGPFHLTMTSEEAAKAAEAFSEAIIIPTHYEGWAHFSEGAKDILSAFQAAKMEHRLFWPKAGQPIEVPLNVPITR